jgi:hypothetical protein
MTAKAWSGSVPLACAAGLAVLCFASSACALDAYWRGTVNSNWNTGVDPNTQLSNWYRDAAGQIPANVPDRTAIFTGTGRAAAIEDKIQIEKIRLEPNAAPVEIGVRASGRLIIENGGIANQSGVTPLFHMLGTVEFHGSARLTSANTRSALFRLTHRGANPGSVLRFRDKSKGGNASVETLRFATLVRFEDEASAQNMVITNLFGNVDFLDRSTGDNAELVNHLSGELHILSAGPLPEGIVKIGAIRNDGLMVVGNRTNLVVRRNLILDLLAEGKLRFEINGFAGSRATRAGNIVVHGATRLGGDLIVDAHNTPVTRGSHRLITATGALTGRFRAHKFLKFPPQMRPRIVYAGKSVFLLVE